MTPAERQQVFNDSVVLNIEDAPKELLERARARFLQRSTQTTNQSPT